MSSTPLVTTAMPVYNGGKQFASALHAIRKQTYKNLEIIICDNASTDGTAALCEAAAAADPRVRYLRHPLNLGPTANFISGLRQKRGEYFMWAAADDEKSPEFVDECLAALQHGSDVPMACTWTTLVTRDGERLYKPYSPGISSRSLEERLQAFVAETHCFPFYGLWRATVLDAIGPPDTWLDGDRRYLFKGAIRGPFAVVPKPLFRFQMMNTLDDYISLGLRMRPGAADFDLDLYHHFPRLIREAGIDEETVRRCRDAMMVPLQPYLDRRSTYLISRVLADDEQSAKKLRLLFAWARQYPPLLRRRFFWGALRRVVLYSRGRSEAM